MDTVAFGPFRDTDEAGRLLQRAVDTARRQGTKLRELRSTPALHRLRPSLETRRQLGALCRGFEAEPNTRDAAAVAM